VIDGDIVRETLHNSLGFSRMDIKENNRLIAGMAKKQMNYFDYILIPIISPYIADRKMAKRIIGNNYFIELFIKTPLEKCIERDTKGLYKKAIHGDIINMIGVSDSNPCHQILI
jgi:adenylylsulfate kinase-like enzyme